MSSLQLVYASKYSIDAINKAYRDYLNEKKKKDDDLLFVKMDMLEKELKRREDLATNDNVYSFDNELEALDFFNNLAQKCYSFLMVTLDSSDQNDLTGEYFFSNGDGKCYQGIFSPQSLKYLNMYYRNLEQYNDDDEEKIDQAFMTNDEQLLLAVCRATPTPSSPLTRLLEVSRKSKELEKEKQEKQVLEEEAQKEEELMMQMFAQ